jgi:pimeloyl-ACP methyl ester carboxylesterase
VRFVSVEKNVNLEVLDWGGSGRSIVLLAGLGNTAHVFDDFAQKLISKYHVYGITRRGYGASSAPPGNESAYSSDRLGDDVLAVLDTLNIKRPILVGHSIAGEELSSVATRYPDRIAGLIYLDAAYPYAFYSRSAGVENLTLDMETLQRALTSLQGFGPDFMSLVSQLLNEEVPAFETDLRDISTAPANVPPRPRPPAPTAEDRASCRALIKWQQRELGYSFPDGECHQLNVISADGHVGDGPAKSEVVRAINAGQRKYTDIRAPILAIYALPHDPGLFYHSNPAALAAWEARDLDENGPVADAFEKGNPSAHVVRLSHAHHYVFLTNEAAVLRAMYAFINSLPRDG